MVWKPDYLTLAEAKAFLRVSDTVDDVEIAANITAASRAIDDHCNRQFGQIAAPAARVYRRPPVWEPVAGMWIMQTDDFQDLTGALVAGVAYASSGAVAWPDNAPADGLPWTALAWPDQPTPGYYGSPASITPTIRWGWSTVPAVAPTATKLQLNRLMARRDSPMGVAGSPDQGSELRLLAKLDPDVIALLKGWRRPQRPG